MKTIGLIGGMSWESTVTYYQIINTEVNNVLKGLHSAKCVLVSVDFAEIEQCQKSGRWEEAGEILAGAAQGLEKAGADCILVCTNTMHKVIRQVKAATSLPVLHIAQATADCLLAENIEKVALLGTAYTMEQDFYKDILRKNGIEVLIPKEKAREHINEVIFNELCHGKINPASKDFFLKEMEQLYLQGAQGVILGCTEIGLLVSRHDTDIPLYDTTEIHAKAAVEFALRP